jgi:hypothetical protein
MIRIVIRGYAVVFRDDKQVTDPLALRSLGGWIYDDERFTDYLGGPTDEDELAATLESGGHLRFDYRQDDHLLTATTEYRSRRPLSESELSLLVEYTMGQWSDGIGENWMCESPDRCGFGIMCLTPGDAVGTDYPEVEVIEESDDA